MTWATYADLETAIQKAMTVRDPSRLGELQPHIRTFDEPRTTAMDIYVTGLIEEFTGNLDDAFGRYQEALAEFTSLHEDWWAANVHINIGSVYYFKSDFANAMAEFQRALDLRGPDSPRVSPILNNIGAVYYNIADFPKALEYFERALRDCQSRKDCNGEAAALGNMGNVYSSMQERESALELYRRALAIHEEHGQERETFMVNCNIAHSLAAQGRLEESEVALDRAEAIARSEHNPQMMERVHSQHIALLRNRRLFDDVERFIEEHSFLETPTVSFRANALRDMGLIWRERGDYDKAISYLEQALSLAEQHDLRSYAEGFHEELMEMAKQSGQFDLYIKHNEEYTQLKEELRGRDASVKIAMYAKERELDAEREEARKHRELLHSTLPASVADRMIRGEDVSGDHHDRATVLFLDVVGFTTHSSSMTPQDTTTLLAQIFDRFDEICTTHGVTKIKTIGDSYMAVAFADAQGAESTEQRAASVALEMIQAEFYWPTATGTADSNRVQFRIGVHSGPVVAGVIGTQRLQYDVWGDTVNTASRMESTGQAGRIQCSEAFAQGLRARGEGLRKDEANLPLAHSPYTLALRGETEIKGKGTMTTFWLEGT